MTITIGRPVATAAPRYGGAQATPVPRRSAGTDARTTGGAAAYPAAPGGANTLFARLRLGPASELRIPSIGLTVPVEEIASTVADGRWYWPVPRDAAAHHLGTANPGEPGNVVISGHVDTREGPGIFARLAEVVPGDTVVVVSPDGQFTYRVDSTSVVHQDDTSILRQGPGEQLTLITCVPDGQYHDRLVVRATRVSDQV